MRFAADLFTGGCTAQPSPLLPGSLTIEKIRAKGLSWRDVFVEIPVAVSTAHRHAWVAGSWSGWHNHFTRPGISRLPEAACWLGVIAPAPSIPHAQVHNSPMAAALAAEIAPPSEVTALDYER